MPDNNYIVDLLYVLFVPLCVFCPLGSIKELEDEKLSLQSDSEHYSDQVTDVNYALV